MNSPTNSFLQKLAILVSSFTLLLASPHSSLAQPGGPQFPDPGHPSISREDQQKLGLQAAAEVYKQMPVLPDSSPETQYIRQIGQRLVGTIPAQYSWPFQFHVVAQKEINAFALPGGEMFVNVGTITAAANEAELAGVMGHEMSHVYMQHSAKQMQKAEVTQGLAGLAGAILGARGGAVGALGQTGVQLGAGMIMLKYSRSDESQADAVGAIILYKAGYNPQALADFFKTLEAQGGTGPQFMSDHPNPGNRDLAIQKEIQGWPPEQYRADSPEFTRVRQQATGVKVYSAEEIAQGAKSGQWDALNRKSGAVFKAPASFAAPEATQASAPPKTPPSPVTLNEVMPSSQFVLAELGPLKILRPENWYVTAPQQQGQSLTIAPRAGVVSNGVGYGVVINGVAPQDQKMTIDQVTDELVRSFQSGDNGMQALGKPTPVTVAGVQGRSVNLQSTSPFADAKGQPQKERDRLVTYPRPDGSVVFLVFVAPEADYQRLNPTFEKMLQSVQ
jgi:predicted Zn-dependent protease